MNEVVSIKPLGDQAIIVSFGEELNAKTNEIVQAFRHLVKNKQFEFVWDVVATFTNVTIFYNHFEFNFEEMKHELTPLVENNEKFDYSKEKYNIHLPVYYNGVDLDDVCEKAGLSKSELISLHTEKAFPIYMVGFLPGFPYVGGLSEQLSIPRLEKPRREVPKGSVGIVNSQSGIYSMSSPGGWNIIGTTPVELIRLDQTYPFYYQAGDKITFYQIDEKKYEEILDDPTFDPKIEVIQDED